jgi:hypothetical protein
MSVAFLEYVAAAAQARVAAEKTYSTGRRLHGRVGVVQGPVIELTTAFGINTDEILEYEEIGIRGKDIVQPSCKRDIVTRNMREPLVAKPTIHPIVDFQARSSSHRQPPHGVNLNRARFVTHTHRRYDVIMFSVRPARG